MHEPNHGSWKDPLFLHAGLLHLYFVLLPDSQMDLQLKAIDQGSKVWEEDFR